LPVLQVRLLHVEVPCPGKCLYLDSVVLDAHLTRRPTVGFWAFQGLHLSSNSRGFFPHRSYGCSTDRAFNISDRDSTLAFDTALYSARSAEYDVCLTGSLPKPGTHWTGGIIALCEAGSGTVSAGLWLAGAGLGLTGALETKPRF
jgi:hypothetical protein